MSLRPNASRRRRGVGPARVRKRGHGDNASRRVLPHAAIPSDITMSLGYEEDGGPSKATPIHVTEHESHPQDASSDMPTAVGAPVEKACYLRIQTCCKS